METKFYQHGQSAHVPGRGTTGPGLLMSGNVRSFTALRPKLRPVCLVSVFTSTSVTILHGVLFIILPNAFLVVSLNQIVELFKILS